MQRFVVDQSTRADLAVAKKLGGASRRAVRKLFSDGKIRVDGKLAKKGDLLAPGAVVDIIERPPSDAELRPVGAAGDAVVVLYQDASLVAVAKPAGIPAHPLERGELGTAANAIAALFPECASVGDDPREGGLVHRLDTGTSGVLIAARSRPAWLALRDQFSRGAVDKTYLAVTEGAPRVLDIRTALVQRGQRSVVAIGDPAALEARTRVAVLASAAPYHLVQATAHSGRMHQIRAHLASVGAALVGDEQYGGPPAPQPLTAFFLHAHTVQITSPSAGRLALAAPLPADRRQTLDYLGFASGVLDDLHQIGLDK